MFEDSLPQTLSLQKSMNKVGLSSHVELHGSVLDAVLEKKEYGRDGAAAQSDIDLVEMGKRPLDLRDATLKALAARVHLPVKLCEERIKYFVFVGVGDVVD